MSDSILTEAEPTSIASILEHPPQEWAREDLDKMIAYFREGRKKWAAEDAQAKTTGKRAASSKGQKAPLTDETAKSLLDNLL